MNNPQEIEIYPITDSDLHYLRSIYGNLTEFRNLVNDAAVGPSLGGEVLADNWNWLDCFIDQHTRAKKEARPSPSIEELTGVIRTTMGSTRFVENYAVENRSLCHALIAQAISNLLNGEGNDEKVEPKLTNGKERMKCQHCSEYVFCQSGLDHYACRKCGWKPPQLFAALNPNKGGSNEQ